MSDGSSCTGSSVAPHTAAQALQGDVLQPGARAVLTTQPGQGLPEGDANVGPRPELRSGEML